MVSVNDNDLIDNILSKIFLAPFLILSFKNANFFDWIFALGLHSEI